MAINIFDVDKTPGSQSASNDVVGRFRSGYQINNRPMSLEKWRVTTGDPEVAEAVTAILGGDEPQEWETKGEDKMEVFTKSKTVDIILDGPRAVKSEMVLWGRAGAIHKCDGAVIHYPDEEKGKPCPNAGLDLKARKDAAQRGTGCGPSITVWFRLADNPDLGRFKFTSGSWSFAKDIARPEEAIADADGPVKGSLTLEVVEFEDRTSGQKRRFVKPVLKITGSVEE